jgi:hypothetical protein
VVKNLFGYSVYSLLPHENAVFKTLWEGKEYFPNILNITEPFLVHDH